MASFTTRVATSLALCGAVLSVPAVAAEPAEQAPTATIHYNDLDLTTDAGARTLQRRLHRAAMAVCPEYDPNNIGEMPAIRACQSNALANAQAQAEVALAKARDGKAYASAVAKPAMPGL
jgi:UrcA family protein